ncbi:MAG: nickel pincer cofactor biosynthesis protein LarB, partial [candidate division WOR-3 bacterium]|nr:nickel pincer cofactor biosynthesis protein LarB [candidate division WOR-3 bacterium]
MDYEKLLKNVRDRKISVKKALAILKNLPFIDKEVVKIDTHRTLRKGVPEIIFGEHKEIEDLKKIVKEYERIKEDCIITRLDKEKAEILKKDFKEGIYYEKAKIFALLFKKRRKRKGNILIITAGTADIPIAEEARVFCEILGNRVEKLYDVGVAGIHRLLHYYPLLRKAKVIIVVAGMEGALPSVVGGITDKPVIAVPTSIGYGA